MSVGIVAAALALLLASSVGVRAQLQNPCPVPTDPVTNTYLGLLRTSNVVFQGAFVDPDSAGGPPTAFSSPIATLNSSQVIFQQAPGKAFAGPWWVTECIFL